MEVKRGEKRREEGMWLKDEMRRNKLSPALFILSAAVVVKWERSSYLSLPPYLIDRSHIIYCKDTCPSSTNIKVTQHFRSVDITWDTEEERERGEREKIELFHIEGERVKVGRILGILCNNMQNITISLF